MIHALKFQIKQLLKMAMQHAVLPCAYGFWRMVYRNQEPSLILFADSHHEAMPFSMQKLHQELEQRGYPITDVICNYANMSQLRSSAHAVHFMRLYAQARFVFICDNYLPVSSCKKDPRTTVVQLLHSGGLFKKMGYDTTQDIPAGYRGNVYKNYDLVTVSAPCCVKPLANAMHQKESTVLPLGTGRTDSYFDPQWVERCRAQFFAQYPEAVGKKIILWSPTFRGNAGAPTQVGMEQILQLEQDLGEDYFLIRKVHPHVDNRYHLSSCPIPTEQLLPVADLMITDYSSVLMDFFLFGKPYVLFAPDLEQFQKERGLYVAYDSLSPYIVTDGLMLKEAVLAALANQCTDWIRHQQEYHMANCDGHACQRILDHLGLSEEKQDV